MKPIGVFYATREGQTRRIAEHVAETLRGEGLSAQAQNVVNHQEFSPEDYAGAVLAASVHSGRHEAEMIAFARNHRPDLEQIPTAFLSVTLSQAGAQRTNTTPRQQAEFAASVQKMIDDFLAQTGWQPDRVKPLAGALLYRKYNFLLRFIMKQIAKKAGGDTDTSRDYEYTDWAGLDRFIKDFAAAIPEEAPIGYHRS